MAWQKYFADTPNFFMAVNGQIAFPNGQAAAHAIPEIARQFKHIELRWGDDLRLDVLTENLCAVAVSYTEVIDPQPAAESMRGTHNGYFTGLVENRNGQCNSEMRTGRSRHCLRSQGLRKPPKRQQLWRFKCKHSQVSADGALYKISKMSSYLLNGGITYAPANSVRAQAIIFRATSNPQSRAATPASSMAFNTAGGITIQGLRCSSAAPACSCSAAKRRLAPGWPADRPAVSKKSYQCWGSNSG